MASFPTYSYLHVTTATGLSVKTQNGLPQPCILGGVSVNKTVVAAITLKDGNTTIGVLAATTPAGMYFKVPMAVGNLNVSMAASTEDITIAYQ